MKRYGRALLILVVTLYGLLPLSGAASAGRRLSLELGTAAWRPFAWEEDGRLSGIAVEVVLQINRLTGLNLMTGVYPPVRLNRMLNHGELAGNYADAPRWNDAAQLRGSVFSEPYMYIEEFIYFKSGHYRRITEPADLTGLRLGLVRGYYYKDYDSLIRQGKIHVDYSGDESQLLQKLYHDRVDCIFMDRAVFRYWGTRLGFRAEMFVRGMRLSRVGVALKLDRTFVYLLPRINRALHRLRRNGTLRRLQRKYGAAF